MCVVAALGVGAVTVPAAAAPAADDAGAAALSRPPSMGTLSTMPTYATHDVYAPKGEPQIGVGQQGTASTPNISSSSAQYLYASEYWSGTADVVHSVMSITQPDLNWVDYHTLSELAVYDGGQKLELGWTIDRSLNGNVLPHLFVFHWVNNVGTCYNGCGFVSVSSSTFPGEVLTAGTSGSFAIEHWQGNWWFYYNGTWFGYFPDSLWNGQFTAPTSVQAFGEVSASSSRPCTQMGNGLFAEDPNSASISVDMVSPSNSDAFYDWATSYSLYSVVTTGTNSIRYGGPGCSNAPIIGIGNSCVDVANANPASGTPIQLWGCNGTNAQQWTHAGNTFQALGKCMDVQWGGTADGTPVWLWDCNGGSAQQWIASPGSGIELLNPASGKCLDATGKSSANGTRLQIWTCTGTANQQWRQLAS